MIALLVMTDGRDDYLRRCLASADLMLSGSITERWIHDDTGDDAYRARLLETIPDFQPLHAGPRRGFGGAIRQAWQRISSASRADYVFHLEQDFLIDRPINLDDLAAMLDANSHLTQLALRRQPWNDAERRAGGIVEQHPGEYAEVSDGEHTWLEHRRFWTTNPSLYRRSLCSREWPTGLESEGRFGISLWASDPALCSAFWGARDSGEWVEHIGHQRVGVGY